MIMWPYMIFFLWNWFLNGVYCDDAIFIASCINDDALPSSLIDSNVSLRWKQWKDNELEHIH
jgi:hypothetical protein